MLTCRLVPAGEESRQEQSPDHQQNRCLPEFCESRTFDEGQHGDGQPTRRVTSGGIISASITYPGSVEWDGIRDAA